MTAFTQQNSTELKKMYEDDQSARMQQLINWKKLIPEDSLHRVRVYQLLDSGKIVTGTDYYHAAMIFQHGKFGDSTSSAMAEKLMYKALALDSSVNRWLLAAAIDRNLMYRGKPQIYGTQYTSIGTGHMHLYTIDTTKITDKERVYYHVGTLQEIREKERLMNLKSIDSFYDSTQSIQSTIALIKTENNKGTSAIYAINEEMINSFGYKLMNAEKNEDALAVFQLNTELYPISFNTFDSLGECLLKLNRKKEAIAAYEKSVVLNPENTNGIEILKTLK